MFVLLTVKMKTAENATDNTSVMAPSEAIIWCVIFSLEALVALATNAVAVIVFLQNTWLRKQASILLLNLAVADLLIGLKAIPGWVYIVGAGASVDICLGHKSWLHLCRTTHSHCNVLYIPKS